MFRHLTLVPRRRARTEPTMTSVLAPDLDAVRTALEGWIASASFTALVAAVLALIGKLRDLNVDLARRLAAAQGRRARSETLARLEAQLAFTFAARGELVPPVVDPLPAVPAPTPTSVGSKTKRTRGGRPTWPAHLPRIDQRNDVPAAQRTCPHCGEAMDTVAHRACEILEVEPARVIVTRRWDETVACGRCDTIVSAETPPQIGERGVLGPRLIAEAACDKYLDHQPIERQARAFRRQGVPVSASTLGASVGAALDLLAPVARAIHDRTRARTPLAMDGTGLSVLDRAAPGNIRLGTMWCWIGDARWISFVFARRGDSDSVRSFLGRDLARTVQCDGTKVTDFLERAHGARPGCWSHARRRFAEAMRGGDLGARVPLHLIAKLAAIEHRADTDRDTVIARAHRRQRDSARVLDALAAHTLAHAPSIPPKTPLGEAYGYLQRQWLRLCLFVLDGAIPLTNNHVERQLRALVLGKHAWLFCGSDDGAIRAATAYTLLATAMQHGLDPRRYLHTVLVAIVDGHPHARLAELLPDRITERHPTLRVPVPTPPS